MSAFREERQEDMCLARLLVLANILCLRPRRLRNGDLTLKEKIPAWKFHGRFRIKKTRKMPAICACCLNFKR